MTMAQGSDIGRIRAVVLTTQRTGSTFLVECLNSHPDIECASEILIGSPDTFGPERRGRFNRTVKIVNILRRGAWRPGNRMSRLYAGGTARVKAFKAMYNQLANPFALRYLRRNEDIRVLHLRRENLLKAHVSRLLMRKRDRVQTTTPVDVVTTHVDPRQAIFSMRKAQSQHERFEALFAGHPRIQIAYEELFDGANLQAITAERICDFLGVARHRMSSRILKLNPESLRDMVTNYDELEAAVSHSEFADFLA